MDSNSPELQEKDMVHEGYKQNPSPFWAWLFAILGIIVVAWIVQNAIQQRLQTQYSNDPFLQVTNRDMSLFLWQNPVYMRVNSKTKTGYLPGFQYLDKVNIEPGFAEKYVQAPPELLFLYHTWERLLKKGIAPRPISAAEFIEFLDYADEWQPKNWSNAPQIYVEFVQNLTPSYQKDLQNSLPLDVRLAFQGWKNFFKEGEKINAVTPTYGQMQTFLNWFPNYARSNWRNISNASYLKTLTFGKFEKDEGIPKNELEPFLRAAFFNAQQAAQKK